MLGIDFEHSTVPFDQPPKDSSSKPSSVIFFALAVPLSWTLFPTYSQLTGHLLWEALLPRQNCAVPFIATCSRV